MQEEMKEGKGTWKERKKGEKIQKQGHDKNLLWLSAILLPTPWKGCSETNEWWYDCG